MLGAQVHEDARVVLGALVTAPSAALECWPVMGAVMGVGRSQLARIGAVMGIGRSQLARLGAVVGVGRSQLARSHHGGSFTPAEASGRQRCRGLAL